MKKITAVFLTFLAMAVVVYAGTVRNIRSQGSTSSPLGGPSWLIECDGASDVVVYRAKNGEWAKYMGGAMGPYYNKYSLEELAEILCGN